jgi:hypothetical protein
LTYCLADLSGSGEITAGVLQLTVGMVAELVGNGHVDCAVDLMIFLAAELQGLGSADSSTLESIAQMASGLAGSGTVTTAEIKTIAEFIADIIGSGNITSEMTGKCFMDSTITSAGEVVTAQSCAQAVWSAVAAAFNEPGTTGNKLNTASTGGVDMEALAAAIIEALEATKIPVNIKQINDVDLAGTGISADKWRPS